MTSTPGERPRKSNGELTLADLCNRFLTSKLRMVQSGELSPRSLTDYKSSCDRLISHFGKTRLVEDLAPEDFATFRASIAEGCGPVRISNEITRCKVIFKYASNNRLIPQPVNYGTEFNKPGKAVLRKHKAKSDKRLFTAEEIRKLLAESKPVMKSAILLAINGGLGNSDISNLEFRNLDGLVEQLV